MSDCYFLSNGSQSSTFPNKMSVSTTPYNGQIGWLPRTSVPWNQTISNAVLDFFTKISYPYRLVLAIPFEDPLRSEIRRFLVSLDAYIESPASRIPEKDILYGSVNLNYAETLKRIKRKSFETSWDAEQFSLPDWWHEVPSYPITDIGQIFNYSYLIFWEEKEPDDYLLGHIPVTINQESITSFKDALYGILPHRSEFQKIESIESLSQISSSSSIERDSLSRKPHYMIKSKYLKFSQKRGISKRSVIRVSPNNTRDSVINDPMDLNTISCIDSQVMEILSHMKGHIHLRDKSRVSRRIWRVYHKYDHFLHRDIKKEGITKPRELLRAMLEVLHSEYPDIEVFRYTNFYDEYLIDVNGKIESMERGHGLGMANALTTLMQLAIHEMVIDRLSNDIPDIGGGTLCINDDFTVGINSEYHLDSYWDTEQEIMDALSILREDQKSFCVQGKLVIAERYFASNTENKKISYQLRELLLPLACYNVSHAKEYFVSAQAYCDSALVPRYMDEVRAFWGWEFHPNEFEYPALVGGWINQKVEGIDMSLTLLDQLPYNSRIIRGFYAAKTQLKKPKRGAVFTPPIVKLLGHPHIPKEFEDHFDILPMSRLHDKYGRIVAKSNLNFEKYWTQLRKRRQLVFNRRYESTYEDMLTLIKSQNPHVEFYPAESMIKCFHPSDMLQAHINDIYIDPNARLACISKFNEIAYPFKETYSIRFTKNDKFQKKSVGLYSKEIERTLMSENLAVMMTGNSESVFIPKGSFKPEEMYINPIRMGQVAAIVDWGKGYPEVFPRFRDVLIEEKREIFGRLFSIHDQYLLSHFRVKRKHIKVIAGYLNDHPDENLEDLLEYLNVNQKVVEVPIKDLVVDPEEWDPNKVSEIDELNARSEYTSSNLTHITYSHLGNVEKVFYDWLYAGNKPDITFQDNRLRLAFITISNVQGNISAYSGSPNALEQLNQDISFFGRNEVVEYMARELDLEGQAQTSYLDNLTSVEETGFSIFGDQDDDF